MTPCSDVIGYQRFGGPCCLRHQGEIHFVSLHSVTNSEDYVMNFHRRDILKSPTVRTKPAASQ